MKQIIKSIKNIAIFLGLLNVVSLTSCKDDLGEVTVPVTGIALNLSELRIQEGVEYHLIPTISPENATNKQVEWSVSDLSVEGCVEIDAQSGLIKPLKSGTALITVTTIDGNFTASCGIEVVKEKIPVESITIPNVYSIVIGEKYVFTPVITPEAPSNRELIWSLENVVPAGCLEINTETGEITAIEEGKATVNVVAADGRGAKSSCEVTILTHRVEPTEINLNSSIIDVEVGGEPVLLKYDILPIDATNRNVVWEIVEEYPSGCAIVDDNGLVSGVKSGMATVRATIKDTELFDECSVTIIGPTPGNGYEIINGIWFIYNLDGLLRFKSEVETNQTVNAKLVKNIDLGTETWLPIGSESKPYSGHFDGNGKSISNLNIDTKDENYKGFFAKLKDAQVSNLGIASGAINAALKIGGITGECENSLIINCYNNAQITPSVTKANAGGIVGNCINSDIIACYNKGKMNKPSGGTINNPMFGGLVGTTGSDSNIIACYNSGEIYHTGGPNLGGIVGNFSTAKMYGVYNVGRIARKAGWAIAGGGNVTGDTSIFGVYWANDIPSSNAATGCNYQIDPDTTIPVSSDVLNSQETVNEMNKAIKLSGNEFAADYEYVVGTGDNKYPVLVRK